LAIGYLVDLGVDRVRWEKMAKYDREKKAFRRVNAGGLRSCELWS
jgi:hypothetical protein